MTYGTAVWPAVFILSVLKRNPLDYFALFDVSVSLSREDPFPLVVLEAASMGKPTVCFDRAGGAKEFVEEDCGYVVPYLDIQAMSSKVVDLLKSVELRQRLGRNALNKVRARCDVQVGGPQLLAVIENFVGNIFIRKRIGITSTYRVP